MPYAEQSIDLKIDFSASGDNTVIADPGGGKYIAIDFISFFPTTATTITLKAGTREKSGAMPLDAKQTITWENAEQSEYGRIHTVPGEAFIMNSSSGIQVSGMVTYRLVGN
jgi:hypothetical protein